MATKAGTLHRTRTAPFDAGPLRSVRSSFFEYRRARRRRAGGGWRAEIETGRATGVRC